MYKRQAYVLADTGAGTTATVVPEKGGMVTSFTKNGDEYSWLREPNFSQPCLLYTSWWRRSRAFCAGFSSLGLRKSCLVYTSRCV